ncbi:hypothetical protein PFX98_07840 [Paucibacter sediminis]|uniref:Uncharacterized protein n=1 Tax=Paucibacter sediminis TaxID=3019553 RepID=A0AA95NJ06_9BURK|nr:hypothetical protein [Paucibacter sp. S2-9]WIT13514.1 hypothetical protein PFX98_07840 [Paucibacter sp. S2-9]
MFEGLLRPIVHWRLARFERRYRYDMSYARELFELSPRAFLQFSKLFGLAAFAQDLPPALLYAAKFAATRHEDCGPCSQLMLDMALQAGVPRPALQALLAEDEAAMPAEMRLGWRYARAALAHAPALAELREELLRLHGPRALASLALAVVVARSFPALKHALGRGQSCTRLELGAAP